MNIKDIGDEILNMLNEVSKEEMSDTNWTNTIKEVIGDIGKKYEFKVCASVSSREFESEWLYDIVWFKSDEGNTCLEEVFLVAESENYTRPTQIEEALFDFEKLLVANAPFKLMLTHTYHDGRLEELQKAFVKAVNAYKYLKKGDSVLHLNYDGIHNRMTPPFWIEKE